MNIVDDIKENIDITLSKYMSNEQLFPFMPVERWWLKLHIPFNINLVEKMAALFIHDLLMALPFVPDYHPDLNQDVVNKANWRIKDLALQFKEISGHNVIDSDEYFGLLHDLFEICDMHISNSEIDDPYRYCFIEWE